MASSGLIGDLLKQTPFGGLGLTPTLTDKEIIIEMTAPQLQQMLLEKADDKAKGAVTVEIHEGKVVLKIRLF